MHNPLTPCVCMTVREQKFLKICYTEHTQNTLRTTAQNTAQSWPTPVGKLTIKTDGSARYEQYAQTQHQFASLYGLDAQETKLAHAIIDTFMQTHGISYDIAVRTLHNHLSQGDTLQNIYNALQKTRSHYMIHKKDGSVEAIQGSQIQTGIETLSTHSPMSYSQATTQVERWISAGMTWEELQTAIHDVCSKYALAVDAYQDAASYLKEQVPNPNTPIRPSPPPFHPDLQVQITADTKDLMDELTKLSTELRDIPDAEKQSRFDSILKTIDTQAQEQQRATQNQRTAQDIATVFNISTQELGLTEPEEQVLIQKK